MKSGRTPMPYCQADFDFGVYRIASNCLPDFFETVAGFAVASDFDVAASAAVAVDPFESVQTDLGCAAASSRRLHGEARTFLKEPVHLRSSFALVSSSLGYRRSAREANIRSHLQRLQ